MTPTPPPPGHTAADLLPPPLRRFVPVLAVATVSAAAVGFLTGIREPDGPRRLPPRPDPPAARVAAAVDYADLPTARLTPAAATSHLDTLRRESPDPFAPVARGEELKRAALADRAANRAYEGAPPTLPHPADPLSSASCLACHGEGLIVGGRVAAKVSHPRLSNCTQCHVEQRTGPAAVANDFAGVGRSGPGLRANPGAPPAVPHHTWLRDDCLSCHGPIARPGLKTTHPWLSNCCQCHAADLRLEQPGLAFGGIE